MKVKIKKLSDKAITPTYATDGSACFDIYASEIVENPLVTTGVPSLIKTDLAFEIPDDYVMLVFSRSGHGFKHGIRLSNCVGVIDSDYRGELMVSLQKDSPYAPPLAVQRGDRVAQALVLPVERVTFEVVDELSDTARGAGGLGSTGK